MKTLVSPHAVSQTQFRHPNTKNKRKRKKWSKRPENFQQAPALIILEDVVVMHPAIFKKLRNSLSGNFRINQDPLPPPSLI